MGEHVAHFFSELSIFIVTGLLTFFVSFLWKTLRMMTRVEEALQTIEIQKKKIESIDETLDVQDRLWSHVLRQEVNSKLIQEGKQPFPNLPVDYFCPKRCDE